MFGDSFFHEQKIYDLKSSVKVVDKCGQISIALTKKRLPCKSWLAG